MVKRVETSRCFVAQPRNNRYILGLKFALGDRGITNNPGTVDFATKFPIYCCRDTRNNSGNILRMVDIATSDCGQYTPILYLEREQREGLSLRAMLVVFETNSALIIELTFNRLV